VARELVSLFEQCKSVAKIRFNHFRSIGGNMLAVSGGDNKVSLWRESVEGQWICISDVNKGQGNTSAHQESI